MKRIIEVLNALQKLGISESPISHSQVLVLARELRIAVEAALDKKSDELLRGGL
jgi:hypothetical protein